MSLNRPISFAFLAMLLSATTGCIGGKSPPSQFYMLEPLQAPVGRNPAVQSGMPVIALAPVRIPQYADRPQIVTATDKNAYKLSEQNRWAERLNDNIARVLAQNLGMLVPADVVLLNALNGRQQAKLRVSVNVLEFHVDPEGLARLAGQWRVTRGEETVVSQQSTCREPASTTDYRVMAGVLNECLNHLSRHIADSIRAVLQES